MKKYQNRGLPPTLEEKQVGINMVDLMMWLVIAALMLATAIQSIGFYQQAGYLYQSKEALNVAAGTVTAQSAIEGAVINDDILEQSVTKANKENTNPKISISWGTVPFSAAQASGTLEHNAIELVSSRTAITDAGVYYLKATHELLSNHEVVYFFDKTGKYVAGNNVTSKGEVGGITPPVEPPITEPTDPPVEPTEPPVTEPTEPPVTGPPATTDPDQSQPEGDVVGTASMVSTWNTSIAGCSVIHLPIGGTKAVSVDWGDGVYEKTGASPHHTYKDTPGLKTIKVTGTFPQWGTGDFTTSRNCVTEVNKWGDTGTVNLDSAFAGSVNLTEMRELPTGVQNIAFLLYGATAFNGDVNIWDTSKVTTMTSMFQNASSFNRDLTNWDTSNVTDMKNMFVGANAFRGNVSNWNTGKVTDMSGMFSSLKTFNGDVSKWNTSKVTTMKNMFIATDAFNGDLSKWDTGNVTDMAGMFMSTKAFNGDVSKWNTSKVTNMSSLFNTAGSFNGDLSKWDTSAVTTMNSMFMSTKFNGDISKWNTSKVTNMASMFYSASSFNRDISGWNTANVTMWSNFRYNSPLSTNFTPAKFR